MHVLFLSRWFPYPPDNGSKLRIHSLLQGLAAIHEVSLISFSENRINQSVLKNVDNFYRDVTIIPWKQFDPKSLRAMSGFFSSKPRSFIDSYSPDMSSKIKNVVASNKFDMVIASQIDTAVYCKDFAHLPALFDEVEIGLLSERTGDSRRGLKRIRGDLTWMKYQHYLGKVVKNFKACTVVSEHEQQLLTKSYPEYHNFKVFPNCVDLKDYETANLKPEPNTMIFTGSFRYRPNYRAMEWFVNEVLPRLIVKIPDIRLTITGDTAGLTLSEKRNIDTIGYVPDIRPLVAKSWVSLAPLQEGGGTRLKILEAMALGTPVISTTKGAQGLDVISGENIYLADTPDEFSEVIIQLLKSTALRQRIADNGKRLVREKYDWNKKMPEFLKLVESIAKR